MIVILRQHGVICYVVEVSDVMADEREQRPHGGTANSAAAACDQQNMQLRFVEG